MSRDFVDDFFDINNIEHIAAYEHLQTYASWPKGFIPADVKMNENWTSRLYVKMGEAWKNRVLEDSSCNEKLECCGKKKDYRIDPDLEDELKIKIADNGYVVESYVYLTTDEDEPETYRKSLHCCDDTLYCYGDEDFSQHDVTDEEIAMFNLLNYIKDYYDVHYDKHKRVNLVVEFENNEEDNEEPEDSGEEKEKLILTKDQKDKILELVNDLDESVHNELEWIVKKNHDESIINPDAHANIAGKAIKLISYIKEL